MGYDMSDVDMLNVQTFAERVRPTLYCFRSSPLGLHPCCFCLQDPFMAPSERARKACAKEHSLARILTDTVGLKGGARFTQVIALEEYRQLLREYLIQRMHNVAPNLSALVGETVGARLISHAGSLTNLAKYPASTVQILGAEKALFRALKTKGNTPKYGLIFHSSFIGRASQKNKGRISRYLANKCSIASRIDCFSEAPSTVFGSKMKEQVEERLAFYDSGVAPRKNIDVMREAMAAAGGKKKKKDKEGKKKKKEAMSEDEEEEKPKKKDKKRKAEEEEEEEKPKKKKDKKEKKKKKKDDSDSD